MRTCRSSRPAGHCGPSFPAARVMVASVVATALGTSSVGFGTLVVAAEASASVALDTVDATAHLASAQTARAAAETRLGQLEGELAALNAEIDRSFAGAAELAADIETARNQMRTSAISAYVNGGLDDRTIDLFSGDDLGEVSGRATFSAGRTVDLSEALADFESLKRDNDPELVALVEQREALNSRVTDARDAVFQSRATEADAERLVAEEAERAAAEAAAADRARQAAAAQAAASQSSQPAKSKSAAPAAGSSPITVPSAVPVARPPSATTSIVILTELSAPLPDLPPGGPSPEAWAEVRRCESGGNYRALSRSGRYRGAYQFDQQTWESMGGVGDPAGALPLEQDARARLLYIQRGVRAWPQCGLALL